MPNDAINSTMILNQDSQSSAGGVENRSSTSTMAGAAPADFVGMLSPELQSDPAIEKFRGKSPDDFFKSYKNLESMVGKKTVVQEVVPEGLLRLPTMDSPSEEIDAFFAALGVPDSPDGYEPPDFSDVADNLPPDFQPDVRIDSWFRKKAHETGLTPGQFQSIYKDFVSLQMESQQQFLTGLETQIREAFGKNYDKAIRDAQRAAGRLSPETQQMAGRIIGKDPITTRILAELGANLGESQSPDGALPPVHAFRASDLQKRKQEILKDPNYKNVFKNKPLMQEMQEINQTLLNMGLLK